MDDRYLELGLIGMATAGEPTMAHFGAAVLAAWWFDNDQRLAPTVATAMQRQAESMIAKHHRLFAPTASRPRRVAPPDELLEALRTGLDGVWAIGHDVIFTALALRTFVARPELCTETVLEGLHRVVDACHEQPLVEIAQVFDVADANADELGGLSVEQPEALARVALETAVGFDHVYAGLHQGNIGHILDHAHALLTLERLGYGIEAAQGRRGFLTHVAALRRVWRREADLPEAPPTAVGHAGTAGYWDRDLAHNDWAFGHAFKYPYALFDLLTLIDDESLVASAHQRVIELV